MDWGILRRLEVLLAVAVVAVATAATTTVVVREVAAPGDDPRLERCVSALEAIRERQAQADAEWERFTRRKSPEVAPDPGGFEEMMRRASEERLRKAGVKQEQGD